MKSVFRSIYYLREVGKFKGGKKSSGKRMGAVTASKHGMTNLERWKTPEHRAWSAAVKRSYDHKCAICGATEGLVAHHLESWDWCPEHRYDVHNGVCLCMPCHKGFHDACGWGRNTGEQFVVHMAKVKAAAETNLC